MSREIFLVVIIGMVLASIFLTGFAFADVSGGTPTPGTPERAAATINGTASAYAGNITELTITGDSITQAWQGYFGNVSGAIRLADNNGDVLYNWSLASPQGEVYATANATVEWNSVQCFNFTALGNYVGDTAGGNTSLNGTNVTQLESQYGIEIEDPDGVNETFTLSGAGTHDEFFVNTLNFSEGECQSTRIFGDTGEGVSNEFEEVIMYDPVTTSVVFASLLEQDLGGYDGNTYDFEMVVLENGHDGDTDATTYYFWVELQ